MAELKNCLATTSILYHRLYKSTKVSSGPASTQESIWLQAWGASVFKVQTYNVDED